MLCFQGLMFQLALGELGRTTGSLEAVLLQSGFLNPLFHKHFPIPHSRLTPT